MERAIGPLGGRIETAIDDAGIYGVLVPFARTIAELDAKEAALEALGFWVTRAYTVGLLAET